MRSSLSLSSVVTRKEEMRASMIRMNGYGEGSGCVGTLGCGVWESSLFVDGFSGEVITSV